MSFRSVRWSEVDWSRVRRITLVPYGEDVAGWVLARRNGRLVLPEADLPPTDAPPRDFVLRLGLDVAGFRRQGWFPFALETETGELAIWSHGARYHGSQPHANVSWWHGSADEAARLLTEQGDSRWAELVSLADRRRRELRDDEFYALNEHLVEPTYLAADTPQAGSGFSGTADEWRAARSMVCDAIAADGSFLDVGCANGYLMECVVAWSAERGIDVEPYGMDLSERLVTEARNRLPQWADRIWVGNAIDWRPPAGLRFDVVHTLLDCVPDHARHDLVAHLLDEAVADGGRLVVSSYVDIGDTRRHAASSLARLGFDVAGETGPAYRPGRTMAPSAWIQNSR